jgi:hypothetical protein
VPPTFVFVGEVMLFYLLLLQETMSPLDTAMRVACRDPELDLITRG